MNAQRQFDQGSMLQSVLAESVSSIESARFPTKT
jgi:hypothetical protein